MAKVAKKCGPTKKVNVFSHFRSLDGLINVASVKEEQGNIRFENEEGSQFKVIIARPREVQEPSYSQGGFMVQEPLIEHYGARRSAAYASGMSSQEMRARCPSLPKGEEENACRLLSFCQSYQGMLEMMEATGYRSRTSFRRRLLTPLMESGLLEQEYKERPNTPKQRYRSTVNIFQCHTVPAPL